MEHDILTSRSYDEYERAGREQLPNRYLEAFQPVTFDTLGYPSRLADEKGIYRYLDSMHDCRLRHYYYECYGYRPTLYDFEKIKSLASRIHTVSKELTGHSIVVKAPLLSSLYALRRLRLIAPPSERITVMELGGGAGILAAMLHEEGYRYISTDVTQAFYLTQNNLWNALYPGQVHECLDGEFGLDGVAPEAMVHIPWWKLWEMRKSDLQADIIIANHCLCEMHPHSLRFYLKWGKHLMRNSCYKLLLAQGPGTLMFRDMDYLFGMFKQCRYSVLYANTEYIVACSDDKDDYSPLPWQDVFRTEDDKKNGHWISQALVNNVNESDPTVAKLLAGEQQVKRQEKVSYMELEAFFHSLEAYYDSPDEEFVHFCGMDRL